MAYTLKDNDDDDSSEFENVEFESELKILYQAPF
jgi:hypothetical protein